MQQMWEDIKINRYEMYFVILDNFCKFSLSLKLFLIQW